MANLFIIKENNMSVPQGDIISQQIEKFYNDHNISTVNALIPEFARYIKLSDIMKGNRLESILKSYNQTLGRMLQNDLMKPHKKEFINLLEEFIKDHNHADRFTKINQSYKPTPFEEELTKNRAKITNMNLSELTQTLLNMDEQYEKSTVIKEKMQIRKIQNEIEERRKIKLGNNFPLGETSKFYQILTNESPKRLAKIIVKEIKDQNETEDKKINAQVLLENSPKELWPKIFKLGEEIDKSNKIPGKKGIKYYLDVIIHKFRVLQKKEVKNKELRKAIKEMNEIFMASQSRNSDFKFYTQQNQITNSMPQTEQQIQRYNDNLQNQLVNQPSINKKKTKPPIPPKPKLKEPSLQSQVKRISNNIPKSLINPTDETPSVKDLIKRYEQLNSKNNKERNI